MIGSPTQKQISDQIETDGKVVPGTINLAGLKSNESSLNLIDQYNRYVCDYNQVDLQDYSFLLFHIAIEGNMLFGFHENSLSFPFTGVSCQTKKW